MQNRVVVVGAGAVGMSCAYYLHQKGYEVHVVDSGEELDRTSCSFGNAGMIVPSHFIPLAAPGVVSQGVKWMMDKKSPLYIKPRMDKDLIKWLYHFWRSSSQQNVDRSELLLYQMNLMSRILFEELEMEIDRSFELERKGLLMLYQTEKYRNAEAKVADKAIELGLEVEKLQEIGARTYVGGLKANVLGGVLYKTDAHLTPLKFMYFMHKNLSAKGVKFHYRNTFKSFIKQHDGTIKGIKTNQGEWDANHIVIAAGTWSSELMRGLGVYLPIQGGKGYSITIPNVEKQLDTPSILCESKVAMTPMGKDLRVAGTMEIAGLDLSINKYRVEAIKNAVTSFFTDFDPKWFNDLEVWAGLRPVSPDGLPYIGSLSKHPNVVVCAGHAMMGLSLSPVSGKLVSSIISGEEEMFPIDILKPERFCS